MKGKYEDGKTGIQETRRNEAMRGGDNVEMQVICADFMATLMPCLNRRACSANTVSGWEMQM